MRATTETLVEDVLANPERYDAETVAQALAIADDLGLDIPLVARAARAHVQAIIRIATIIRRAKEARNDA